MLMFASDRIRPAEKSAGLRGDESFLPGEIFVMKYMGIPEVVTVLSRTPETVELWFGKISPFDLNRRVLFRLGRRARFLGLWLPWARVNPQRVIALDLDDNLGTDDAFWKDKAPATSKSSQSIE